MAKERIMIIDRFEGDWAVIEYGRDTFNFPRALLPEGAREGDVVRFAVQIDNDNTPKRRKKAEESLRQLFDR